MAGHNIQIVVYLLSAYKNMSNEFGYKASTVRLFKMNMSNMISINQVNNADANLVYRMLSIENTDVVKAEQSMKRVENLLCMIRTMEQNVNNRAAIDKYLNTLLKGGKVSDKEVKLACELFGYEHGGGISKNGSGADTDKFKKFTRAIGKGKYIIRVKNTQALCSGDPNYFDYDASIITDEMLNTIEENENKFAVMREVYELYTESTNYTVDENLTKLLHSIDISYLRGKVTNERKNIRTGSWI